MLYKALTIPFFNASLASWFSALYQSYTSKYSFQMIMAMLMMTVMTTVMMSFLISLADVGDPPAASYQQSNTPQCKYKYIRRMRLPNPLFAPKRLEFGVIGWAMGMMRRHVHDNHALLCVLWCFINDIKRNHFQATSYSVYRELTPTLCCDICSLGWCYWPQTRSHHLPPVLHTIFWVSLRRN